MCYLRKKWTNILNYASNNLFWVTNNSLIWCKISASISKCEIRKLAGTFDSLGELSNNKLLMFSNFLDHPQMPCGEAFEQKISPKFTCPASMSPLYFLTEVVSTDSLS